MSPKSRSLVEHFTKPWAGQSAGAVRLKGCFVVGRRMHGRRLHLPVEACLVWSHSCRAKLVARTGCGAVLRDVASVLHPTDHLEMCDRCAAADGERFIVYRFFGADDALLYVGYSADFPARLKSHRVGQKPSPWFPLVARWTLVSFPTSEAALDYETAAIQSEHPIYNVRHNDALLAAT